MQCSSLLRCSLPVVGSVSSSCCHHILDYCEPVRPSSNTDVWPPCRRSCVDYPYFPVSSAIGWRQVFPWGVCQVVWGLVLLLELGVLRRVGEWAVHAGPWQMPIGIHLEGAAPPPPFVGSALKAALPLFQAAQRQRHLSPTATVPSQAPSNRPPNCSPHGGPAPLPLQLDC